MNEGNADGVYFSYFLLIYGMFQENPVLFLVLQTKRPSGTMVFF